ncbi:hypothetical protein OKJ48_36540 [Streptomyces kunmingensis]|uniref:Uncharacterized protein n=1 Tax=Streptomyces kunmingensis TaxID=68225 RepID=A0ABU6CLX1_9ACTN|nr:hypothetical protein [Streptomyces kunmingensis]MEB3965692.1 hypothetical protein [Streptomyces kunmingensis]
MDEEEFMRGRVYGADHEDAGPRLGRTYAQLLGGPLDGLLLDVTDRPAEEARGVVALLTELGAFGSGGRALYGPVDADGRRLAWQGDAP